MKHLKLSNALRAILVSAAMASASAGAAPILLEADTFNASSLDAGALSVGAAETTLFSHMRLNGGQSQTVAFLGDDNSIMIGYYARGPWAKSEFLRRQQIQPPVSTVPEPSTFALLGLGLLAVGVLRRRQTTS